jgi:hypothetical protein
MLALGGVTTGAGGGTMLSPFCVAGGATAVPVLRVKSPIFTLENVFGSKQTAHYAAAAVFLCCSICASPARLTLISLRGARSTTGSP